MTYIYIGTLETRLISKWWRQSLTIDTRFHASSYCYQRKWGRLEFLDKIESAPTSISAESEIKSAAISISAESLERFSKLVKSIPAYSQYTKASFCSLQQKWISVLDDFTKIIRISNLLGWGREKLGKSVSLFLSMSKCPTLPNPPTWPGICWIALAARTPLIAPYSVLTDITAPLQLWKTISFPISYNPKILSPNLNHSQNSFPDALGSFTARGKSAERRPCQVRLSITYLIIVADAADAVSVNFSGRCKFLQI